MEQRNIGIMIPLMLVTAGLYMVYWLVVTKLDFNDRGAHIPTSWLLIIPLANIYFLYKFTEAFARIIFKNEQLTVPYFLLLMLLLPVGILICQHNINDFLKRQNQNTPQF